MLLLLKYGYGTVGYDKRQCHSCKGKDWIKVKQEINKDQNG